MKRFLSMLIIFFLVSVPVNALARPTAVSPDKKTLFIATTESKPLALDRLLYTALKEIGYQANIKAYTAITSYNLANDGERDGVVSTNPLLNNTYTYLKRVSTPLDRVDVVVYAREPQENKITEYDDLSGKRVGVLSQHAHIDAQLSPITVITYKDSNRQLVKGLLENEYDYAIVLQHTFETLNSESNLQRVGMLESLNEYLYLNETVDDELSLLIADSLTQLSVSGRAQRILMDLPDHDSPKKRTIIHLISTNMAIDRESLFSSALYASFADDEIEWYPVELDAKRYSGDTDRLNVISQLMRKDFLDRNLSAIIVSGDEALHFLEDYYLLFFKNTPVIFYGIDSHFDEDLISLQPYLTGIVTQLSAHDTVTAALEQFPNTAHLFVVNDYTDEGLNYQRDIREQLTLFEDRLEITYNDNIELNSLIQQIGNLPQDTILLIGSYFTDVTGQFYSQSEIIRLLTRDCPVPAYALYSVMGSNGVIGGKCPDYSRYADTVSAMLGRVLDGSPMSQIPLVLDSSALNAWYFDQESMNRFQIKSSALPTEAQIINQTLTIWETNPTLVILVITALGVSVIVITGLSVFTRKLRKQNQQLIEMQDSLSNAEEMLAKDAKIKEVKDRLERLISTAPVAYAATVNSIIVETNDYMRQHVGMQIGDHILDYYSDPNQRQEVLSEVEANQSGSHIIVSIKMPDGGIHRFLANIGKVEYDGEPGYMMWIIDIEDNEQRTDQLANSQRSLQTMLDTMPIPVFVSDVGYNSMIYANQAFFELFNVKSMVEIFRSSLLTFLPEKQPDGTDTRELLQSIDFTQTPRAFEITCLTRKGRTFDSQLTVTHIEYQGQSSYLGIVKNMTSEKAYQNMLLLTAEQEKEANLSKSRFLVNMSHEIRTPMNAIIGLTEIEMRNNKNHESIETFKKISNSAKNLLTIVNDIMDLSKIEANKMEIYANEFNLEDVLGNAMLVATPRLDGKPVDCMLKIGLDVPQQLIGDQTRLWQITKNFLDNSAKYTEKGRITLTVTVDEQSSNEETVQLSFIITDTGIGISDENMERLFTPYQQVYSNAQTRYSGTGLGLVISKQLCEMMGGKMTVVSKPNVGTSIQFTIPFKRAENRETQRHALRDTSLEGKNILVVDDDAFSQDVMLTLLSASKAKTLSARSGEEALEKVFDFRKSGQEFDCILLDYRMEGLNGLETALQINLSLSNAPKMLMVAPNQRELPQIEMQDAGISGTLEKPFIPSEFIRQVNALFGYQLDEPETDTYDTVTQFEDVRILICEDNKLNQEVATGMLAQFGLKPEIADDGCFALSVLDGRPVDLIFMDLHMPKMDGYATTRMLRNEPMYKDIPIISLTADAMTEVAEKCIEAGMNDNLTKPIHFDSLHNMLRKWLPHEKRSVSNTAVRHPNENKDGADYPVIKGIDYADGVSRFGGNRDLYEKSLLSYAKTLPEVWPTLEEVKRDIQNMAKEIHTLKGVSGNLGVMDVYQLTVDFEKTLKQGKPDQQVYGLLKDACNRCKKIITEAIVIQTNGAQEQGSAEELKPLLLRLKEALEEYDPTACEEVIALIDAKIWPDIDKDILQSICEQAMEYAFDDALDQLVPLIDA